MITSEAWQLGEMAAASGRKPSSNPYSIEHDEFEEWNEGYVNQLNRNDENEPIDE